MKTCFCHLLAKACLLVFSSDIAPSSFGCFLYKTDYTVEIHLLLPGVFLFWKPKKDAAFLIWPGFVCVECTITMAQMDFCLSIFPLCFLSSYFLFMNKWIKTKHKDAVSGSTLSFLWRSPGHQWHLCCSSVCGQHVLVSAISNT